MSHASDHSCIHCEAKFSNKRALATHIYREHKEVAKREGNKRMKLSVKMKEVFGEEDKEEKVSCSVCKRVFANKMSLTDHLISSHDWTSEDVERFFNAKDTDRIITLRLEGSKNKENYRVYYKDEEIDVFVTVKDGDGRQVAEEVDTSDTNENRKGNSNTCKNFNHTLSECIEQVEDNSKESKSVYETVEVTSEDVQYKCLYLEGDEAFVSNAGDGNFTLTSLAAGDTQVPRGVNKVKSSDIHNLATTSLSNSAALVPRWNKVEGKTLASRSQVESSVVNATAGYIVQKPEMVGTIHDNEEVFIVVPDDGTSGRGNAHSRNTVVDGSVDSRERESDGFEMETGSDVFQTEAEYASACENEASNIEDDNGDEVSAAEQIVVVVDQDIHKGTFVIDGQEFEIVHGDELANVSDDNDNKTGCQSDLEENGVDLFTHVDGEMGDDSLCENMEENYSNPQSDKNQINDVVELIADNYSITDNVQYMEAQDASPVSLETSLQQSSIDTQGTGTRAAQDNGHSSHLDLGAASLLQPRTITLQNLDSDINDFKLKIEERRKQFERSQDFNMYLDKLYTVLHNARAPS